MSARVVKLHIICLFLARGPAREKKRFDQPRASGHTLRGESKEGQERSTYFLIPPPGGPPLAATRPYEREGRRSAADRAQEESKEAERTLLPGSLHLGSLLLSLLEGGPVILYDHTYSTSNQRRYDAREERGQGKVSKDARKQEGYEGSDTDVVELLGLLLGSLERLELSTLASGHCG
jgi:hypothetical protein